MPLLRWSEQWIYRRRKQASTTDGSRTPSSTSGGRMPINRIRFFPRPSFEDNFLPWFELGVASGSAPIVDRPSIARRGQRWFYQISRRLDRQERPDYRHHPKYDGKPRCRGGPTVSHSAGEVGHSPPHQSRAHVGDRRTPSLWRGLRAADGLSHGHSGFRGGPSLGARFVGRA